MKSRGVGFLVDSLAKEWELRLKQWKLREAHEMQINYRDCSLLRREINQRRFVCSNGLRFPSNKREKWTVVGNGHYAELSAHLATIGAIFLW